MSIAKRSKTMPHHLSTPWKAGVINTIKTVKVLKLTFPNARPISNNNIFKALGIKKSTS